jgi:hypothetical protein
MARDRTSAHANAGINLLLPLRSGPPNEDATPVAPAPPTSACADSAHAADDSFRARDPTDRAIEMATIQ